MSEATEFDTIGAVDRAIEKLRRRIADLQKFMKLGALDTPDVAFHVSRIESSVKKTIAAIYGANSRTAREFASFQIAERRPKELQSAKPGELDAFIKAFAALAPNARVSNATARLERLIAGLQEHRSDLMERTGTATLAQHRLNRAILDAAFKLFSDGHYADAVFAAAKVLIQLVKTRAGRSDLDGVDLMQTVFSPNRPTLKFNALKNQTDRDEQQGMMNLYVGAVQAIRNPRGHTPGVADTPERAVQYLEVLSLLADRLDETVKPPFETF